MLFLNFTGNISMGNGLGGNKVPFQTYCNNFTTTLESRALFGNHSVELEQINDNRVIAR